MKKFFLAGVLLVSGFLTASAQSKIGYINTEDLINSMPEADKANAELQDYQNALNQQGNEYLSELKEKDSALAVDSPHLSQAIIELKKNDLMKLYQQVQGWNQQSQQLLGQKQQTLLAPIRDKALESIKVVAKENGYGYILDASALIVSPPGDDILPLVKKKLGIKDAPATGPKVQKGN